MKTSQRGLAEIAGHEGIVTSCYLDSVGVKTIGIGHTALAGAPDPGSVSGALEIAEIMEIFARDIARFEARVAQAFTRPLTQAQFDAAVSFDFNTGGILRASWVRHFNEGNDEAAYKAFMNWSKPGQIIPRRKAERDLFFKAHYSHAGYASVIPVSPSLKPDYARASRVNVVKLLEGSKPPPRDHAPAASQSRVRARLPVVAAAGVTAIMAALAHWRDVITHFLEGLFP